MINDEWFRGCTGNILIKVQCPWKTWDVKSYMTMSPILVYFPGDLSFSYTKGKVICNCYRSHAIESFSGSSQSCPLAYDGIITKMTCTVGLS